MTVPTAILTPNYKVLAQGTSFEATVNGVFVPLEALEGVDMTEATNSGEKVLFGMAKAYIKYQGEGNSLDSLTVTEQNPIAIDPNCVRKTYAIAADIDISGADLKVE